MDFSHSSAISAAGMDVERTRLDVAAMNLANVHTSRASYGGPFRPLRVVNTTAPVFSQSLAHAGHSMLQIPSAHVQQTYAAPRLVYEPGHPDANAKGFVAYPAIDNVSEMVNLMTAVRTYEANVVAMNAAKSMALKALDIGRGT
ncbi:flagellar basal body rod protein FlgC [Methylobacillus arboreus]|uniref:flagellar basal body rod protein FlgC n=1 Tax=Methylobacillus arboreus TaxID=755170 RepID=UPI001E340859|nr:flagellar basal body rod protein FlgC [Methylobacillus arboreus]MCB5191879.1 flagellar basal body rod protein FlgC [Methylobacillus arboreus]